jgi:hypothetical protein
VNQADPYLEGDAVRMDYAALATLAEDHFNRLLAEGRLDYDANQVRYELANAYQELFGNFPEVARPEWRLERWFDVLLASAIQSRQPLTVAQVAAAAR